MKKQIFKRCLSGVMSGIAIGYIISIISSLIYGDGNYYPCVPSFVQQVGNTINAVLIQTIFCGIIGAISSGASIIWDLEKWSLLKQTLIYLIVELITVIPIAYYLHWVNGSVKETFIFVFIFVFIFMIIWYAIFLYNKIKFNQINKKIKKLREK